MPVFSKFSSSALTRPAASGSPPEFTWRYTITNPTTVAGDGNNFGTSLLYLSADKLYAADGSADVVGFNNPGRVWVWDAQTGTPGTNIADPNLLGAQNSDRFGHNITGTASRFAVLAYNEGTYGTVFVYDPLDTTTHLYTIVGTNSEDVQSGMTSFGNSLFLQTGSNASTIREYDFSTGTFIKNFTVNGSQRMTANATYLVCTEIVSGNTNNVSLYLRSTGAKLYTWSNPAAQPDIFSDLYGSAIAVTDQYTFVGAPKAQVGATENDMGKVYVYSNSTGELVNTLTKTTDPGWDAEFGQRLLVTDKYLIVGSPGYDYVSNGFLNSNGGNVTIFKLSTLTPVFSATSPSPNAETQLDYGWNLAFAGNTLAVMERITQQIHVYTLT